MADEMPEGQSQDPGANTQPDAAWWPWPETHAEEPTGPRDGAPGDDQTMSLPVEAEVVAAGSGTAEPDADEPREPEPEPGPEPEPEPEPGPEPVVEGTRPAQAAEGRPVVIAGAASLPAPSGESPWVMAVATDDRQPPNEAIPAVAPEAGSGPIGSIPAAQARAVWSRLQASNWRLFLIRFLSAGLAVVLTVAIVPGLGFTGWRWGDFLRIAVIFGLLNATVKPLLQFLVLRFIFSTYGIVVVVINTLLLVLLAAILEGTFEAARPLSILFGGLVVGVLGLILETLLGATPPTLDRDYKERNGLS